MGVKRTHKGIRIGRWLFWRGDLFRIVAWSADGHPQLANWSRPRIYFLRAWVRRAWA